HVNMSTRYPWRHFDRIGSSKRDLYDVFCHLLRSVNFNVQRFFRHDVWSLCRNAQSRPLREGNDKPPVALPVQDVIPAPFLHTPAALAGNEFGNDTHLEVLVEKVTPRSSSHLTPLLQDWAVARNRSVPVNMGATVYDKRCRCPRFRRFGLGT